MKSLQEILYGVAITEVIGNTGTGIEKICFDSRLVVPGTLFVAVKGTVSDGHQYIAEVVAQGAVAVICEHFPEETSGACFIKVENSAKALGIASSNFFDNPSDKLKLVGITGTNGKTTVATLLFRLFRELGYKVGLISTVQNQINGEVISSTHTTPDQISLNSLLNDMVISGCDYCFMEVSSHALAQYRTEGLFFTGGVFTNITHDHLDYHKTFGAYINAKKMFFDKLVKSAFALTNSDDKNGMVMLQNTRAHQKSFGLKNMADFKAKIIENSFNGLLLNLDGEEVWFKQVGSFNAYNLLAVYAVATLLEQDRGKTLTVLSRLDGAEGRFECIVSANGVIGIVDYAHTPDAIQNVLNTINDIRKGTEQVITIIGCGGDRDKSKRPVMAKIAAEQSDKVILTSDNPRSEIPEEIIHDMEDGITPVTRKRTLSITDRKEAIRTACHLAKTGDIILLAGKGHEKYQEVKGVKYPFDDKQILVEMLTIQS